jgi:hypothetical protein
VRKSLTFLIFLFAIHPISGHGSRFNECFFHTLEQIKNDLVGAKRVGSAQEDIWSFFESGRTADALSFEAKLEDTLLNGTIIKHDPKVVGVFPGKFVDIINPKTNLKVRAIFKSKYNSQKNHHLYEIAAYRVSRLLKLNIVPMTVFREIEGKEGSLQFVIPDFEHGSKNLNQVSLKIKNVPELRFLNFILSNFDTHGRNFLLIPNRINGRTRSIIGIDHGLAFERSFNPPSNSELKNLKTQKIVRALSETSDDEVRQILKGLVAPHLIEECIARFQIARKALL